MVWTVNGVDYIEDRLQALDELAPAKFLNKNCYDKYYYYYCANAYAKCELPVDESQVKYACKSTCTDAYDACEELFTSNGKAEKLPDCEAEVRPGIPFPETNCIGETAEDNPSGSQEDETSEPVCPAGFIYNLAAASSVKTCNKATGCCLSCPAFQNFFPTG